MSALYVPTRRIIYITLGKISRMLHLKEQQVFILCYHSISNDGWDFSVNKREFEKQIKYLSTRYQFVSLRDIVQYLSGKKTLSSPSVAITFDDGYKDILSIVPLLKSLGVRPTVFVISNQGNENKMELGTDRKFLNAKDINRLIENAWEVGSHTRTHPDLNLLTEDQLNEEITRSKGEIEMKVQEKVYSLAFPKGRYSRTALLSAKKAGYKMCLTMNDGIIAQNSDPFQMPRIGVDGTHSFEEFKVLASPLAVLFRKLLKKNYYVK